MSTAVTGNALDQSWRRATAFLTELFHEPQDYSIILGNETILTAAQTPKFSLVFRDPGVIRRLFSPPLELSLGEGYIRGDMEILGNIYSAFDILNVIMNRLSGYAKFSRLMRDYLALPAGHLDQARGRGPLDLQGEVHSRERDRKAVQYHYDVGNDFYSIWLDKNMQYSCGYFPSGSEDLDTAQVRKMEHICRKLRLQPGETLLDIGCGWGGLLRYAAQRYGVRALGVTLSKQQAAFANQKAEDLELENYAKVELKDYRDLSSGSFDKIVSVGMFEHVGRSHLPEYFSQVYRLLKFGGLFLNHGIAMRMPAPRMVEVKSDSGTSLREVKPPFWKTWLDKNILATGSFSQKYIFPDGELELVSDANMFGEKAGFEVRDVENLREHYALTIRNWVKNLADHQPEVEKASDPITYRTWRLYLASSVYGFESGVISVNQTLFSKPTNGKNNLPYSREDLYRPFAI